MIFRRALGLKKKLKTNSHESRKQNKSRKVTGM